MVGWAGEATRGPFTVAEIARHVGGRVEGDGSLVLVDLLGLAEAGPEHLTFLSNRRYLRQFESSRAGAVLLDEETADPRPGHTVIRCADPYVAFARALALFYPQPWPEPGIDPRAVVAEGTEVEGATLEAFTFVGPGAKVGPGSWLEFGAYVGSGAEVGAGCRLMPHSVVAAGCRLGDRVWLNPGVVVGGEGFGFAPSAEGHVKIPQTGRAVVEDDVEIGSNSAVDRATFGDTVVGRGAKIDNLVQVAHGAEIGEGSLLVAFTGVAGSAKLGKGVVMAAKSGVINHGTIGDGAQVATGARVLKDLPAGARVAGYPAMDHGRWLRSVAAFGGLPELVKRLRALEKRIAELEAELEEPKDSA